MSSDFWNISSSSPAAGTLLFKNHQKEEPINNKVKEPYIPNETNCPINAKMTISFCNSRIGSPGNLTVLCSAPKQGKSAVCEALIASHLNPSVDTFGIRTHNINGKRIVYMDGEQSKQDNWMSWRRVLVRAKVPHYFFPDTETEGPRIRIHEEGKHFLKMFSYQCHAVISDISERKELITKEAEKDDIGILIVDGFGDFLRDVNRADEVTDLYHFFNALAQKHNLTIFGTIHVNHSSAKARGHLGSELYRRCEGCIFLDKDDFGVRRLTTDFGLGLVRSDKAENTLYFSWNEDGHMFTTCEIDETYKGKRETDTESERIQKLQIMVSLLDADKRYGYTELKNLLKEKTGISEKTAERRVKEMAKVNLINKDGTQYLVNLPNTND